MSAEEGRSRRSIAASVVSEQESRLYGGVCLGAEDCKDVGERSNYKEKKEQEYL